MEVYLQHLLLYLTAYLRDLGNSKCVYTNIGMNVLAVEIK